MCEVVSKMMCGIGDNFRFACALCSCSRASNVSIKPICQTNWRQSVSGLNALLGEERRGELCATLALVAEVSNDAL